MRGRCPDAGDRAGRRPVGRRGQGQGDRPAGQQRRLRREVQRRQQRRPHDRHRTSEKYALHLLPSGILSPGCTPVIGNGVVIDLAVLFQEIDGLEARGVDTSRLVVSANAHVIPPYNRVLDKVTERFLGSRRIGTTGRGIGPTYADKMSRVGIRVQDLFDEKILRQKVEAALDGQEPGPRQDLQPPRGRGRRGRRTSCSRTPSGCGRWSPTPPLLLEQALDRGQDRAARGRPGHAAGRRPRHLPVRHVLATRPPAAPAPAPGIPPTRIDAVIAILKAYTTRVGEGPFPTELFDDMGEFLRKTGAEYGTTTGRPRRCGWLDTVVGRYATRINGVTDFVVTKLDVLTGLDTVPVCVAYDVDGVRHDEMPMSQTDFHHATPIYEELARLVGGHLRAAARSRSCRPTPRRYVERVEELIGARVSRRSASAPAATRSSSGTRCSASTDAPREPTPAARRARPRRSEDERPCARSATGSRASPTR